MLDDVPRELVDCLTGSSVPGPIRHQGIHPVIVGREKPLGEREREVTAIQGVKAERLLQCVCVREGVGVAKSESKGDRCSQNSSGGEGGEVKDRLDVRVVCPAGREDEGRGEIERETDLLVWQWLS